MGVPLTGVKALVFIAGALSVIAALLFPAVLGGGGGGNAVSGVAVAEIPAPTLALYMEAAATCDGLPWPILAGIGWVETRHARGQIYPPPDMQVDPPIVGPKIGHLAPPDDHAYGPMQFLPSSWKMFGVDANGNGDADPHELPDAIHAAVRHLCPTGTLTDVDAAINAYSGNTSGYLDAVHAKAAEYSALDNPTTAAGPGGVPLPGGWATPTPPGAVRNPSQLREPHHDYPAWDFLIPTGTPIYALRAGQVVSVHTFNANWWTAGCTTSGRNGCSTCGIGLTIVDDLGTRTTYCHGSAIHVSLRQPVAAGQHILDSGDTGRSGTPHLHLEIRTNGTRRCPQPLLVALYTTGTGLDPSTLPTTGCSF